MGVNCSTETTTEEVGNVDQTSAGCLTPKDIDNIQDSWKQVYAKESCRVTAPKFFLLLFKMHPYMKEYFTQFRGKSLDEIRISPVLRAHSIAVFSSLSTLIECLDDTEALPVVISKMAGRHYYRNVTFHELENFREVFLVYIAHLTGGHTTAESRKSWEKLFRVHNHIYRNRYLELAQADEDRKHPHRKSNDTPTGEAVGHKETISPPVQSNRVNTHPLDNTEGMTSNMLKSRRKTNFRL